MIDRDGKVGIGITSPAEKLDVLGTAQVTGFKMPTGATSGYVLTSNASGVGTWQPAAGGGIGGSGTTNYIPKFTGSTTLGNSVIYESAGKVGIGTTSPEKLLHVAGSAKVNDTLFASNLSSNSPLSLQTAGTTRMYINDANGNIGIGTTNPQTKLHVSGYVQIEDGTHGNGKVLTSDANGKASWQTTTSGSSLGAWVDKSSSYGAQQASTDGFVIAYVTGSYTGWLYLDGYTDTNTNPTTIRQKASCTDSRSISICMPVKKGDYWKIVYSGVSGGNISVFWIPLGT